MIILQSAPAAGILTPAYFVPTGKEAVLSSLIVCNRDPAQTNFRMSLAKNGVPDAPEQYIYYDVPIPGNDTFIATIGVCLNTADVVRVYSTSGIVSFTVTGIERDPI